MSTTFPDPESLPDPANPPRRRPKDRTKLLKAKGPLPLPDAVRTLDQDLVKRIDRSSERELMKFKKFLCKPSMTVVRLDHLYLLSNEKTSRFPSLVLQREPEQLGRRCVLGRMAARWHCA